MSDDRSNANIDKLALSTSFFGPERQGGARMGDFLEFTLNAGIDMVEVAHRLPDGDDSILDALRNSGIKVWSIHGIMNGLAISPDKAERDKAVELAYRHAAGFAEFAPCPLVEHYLYRSQDPAIGDYFRYSIEKLYEKVSKLGYILCIETAPYKPKEFSRHPDSAEIADFVRSFQKDDLQMTVDLNHSNLTEDLVVTAANTRGAVKNIHVANNYGEKEQHLPPDEGVIDIKRAFDALRENGYTGPCNLEFSFHTGEKLPEMERLIAVRKYMEKLLWNR